ncbi:hypothetical protein ACH4E7_13860 [Kitasatospora sp. NPDC018058]|uniref:hypothetical protein n=1 Tax=Kitasatospora sp. NPDC018058 TaxID=3364025 RepID=UPI0037C04170
MSSDAVQSMVDRLKALNWTSHGEALEKSYSRAALMKEYLRRTALWLDVYGDTRYWPVFDLAAIVAPEVRAAPAVVADVKEFVDAASHRWYAAETSVAAVQWAALSDVPGLNLPPLPDPFEPLIRVYERGGLFSYANGFVDFDTTMVPCRDWRAHLSPTPVVELDDAALDALDDRSWAELRTLAGSHQFPGRQQLTGTRTTTVDRLAAIN